MAYPLRRWERWLGFKCRFRNRPQIFDEEARMDENLIRLGGKQRSTFMDKVRELLPAPTGTGT